MAFKKGDPKPPGSGMRKGQTTVRSAQANEIFKKHDFDPLDAAIERLKEEGPAMDADVYVNCCLKLAKFKHSELKSIDHHVDLTGMKDQELIEETERLMNEVKGKA